MSVQPTGGVPWKPEPQRPTSPANSSQTNRPAVSGNAEAEKANRPQESATPPTDQQLQQALSDLQEVIAPLAHDLQFSIDDESGRTVVKIVDSATDEVVKQFPSEQALQMSKSVKEYLQGLLVDKTV